jgi:transposase
LYRLSACERCHAHAAWSGVGSARRDSGDNSQRASATVGNGHDFKESHQFAAWRGLVPRQYGSGGKDQLGRIYKAGDPYLRTLLMLGARAVLHAVQGKADKMSKRRWSSKNAEGWPWRP